MRLRVELVMNKSNNFWISVSRKSRVESFPPVTLKNRNVTTRNSRLLQEVNKTFSGCIRNFMLNGEHVGEPSVKTNVIPCSKRVEPGMFFYPGNGTNWFRAGNSLASSYVA